MASKILMEKLQAFVKYAESTNTFHQSFKQLNVVNASPGKVHFDMEVQQEHTNLMDTLHGGLTSTLIDVTTTYAILTLDETSPGVSLSLDVNFLKAARVGEKIQIEAEVLKKGRTIAFTKARILNQKGDIIAIGNHVKHVGS